jgi:hypothetical protein
MATNILSSPLFLLAFTFALSLGLWALSSRIKQLPSWLQPLVPIVLAIGAVMVDRVREVGFRQALVEGLTVGVGAIGVYHASGKVTASVAQAGPKGSSALLGLVAATALCSQGCAALKRDPVSAAKTAISIAHELCSLDISEAPTVRVAAAKHGTTVVDYAREICDRLDVVAPYAKLLEGGQETAGLVSPLEEARQRATEQGRAAGVL